MNLKVIAMVLLSLLIFAGSVPGKKNFPSSTIDAAISELLNKMTLEEKVGQMTQISLEVVAKGDPVPLDPLVLDLDKLRHAIVDYHVGSILNVGTHAHSVEKWNQIITQIQDVAMKETRLKIPILYGLDSVHGAGYIEGATLFPQNLGMAATWDPELMRKNGEITALEMRAAGIPWNFSPVLGTGRQPLWPRLWETFGEDPYLASVFGAAYIKGLEGENNEVNAGDKVAACMKHYLGYSLPYTGKDRTPAYIPERMLREYFLLPFKAAIDAGAHTLMVNSSEINGIPVHSSYFYLTVLLRQELGFRGFVVSDWNDIKNLHERDRIAETEKEAVRMAVMAGIDMSMVPLDYSFCDLLVELVRESRIPEARINESVRRILRVKFQLGLFENPYPQRELVPKFASEESRKVNLQAARESITLLKNVHQILPLARNKKILVTGPTANRLSNLNGGWTITWQGDREELYPKDKLTIVQAIQKKVGKTNVRYVPGVEVEREIDIPAAVAAARSSDVAVICLGENPYCETRGNINDLTLPEPQIRLVSEMAGTGIPVVLVLVEGRPRIIRKIVDRSAAILLAYLPGMEGGAAIADVLFGDVNPGGKLPITYPRFPNDLTLYDHKNSENYGDHNRYNPQFPFGYGLSYTRFRYENLILGKAEYSREEPIHIDVTVTNTGSRAGAEVVQLYLRDLYASVTPPTRRLKRFRKIWLQPGESRTLSFTLFPEDLAFVGRNKKPVIEPGEFEVLVADLSEKFILR